CPQSGPRRAGWYRRCTGVPWAYALLGGRPDGRIVVGVLVVGGADGRRSLLVLSFGGRRVRQVPDVIGIGQPALDAVLIDRREIFRAVERADGDADPLAVDVAEGQRRAALAAKAALGDVGGAEDRDRAAGQLEGRARTADQRRIEGTEGLLAHAAMTHMRAARLRGEAIAHCAALAAARPGLSHDRAPRAARPRYRDPGAGRNGCRS